MSNQGTGLHGWNPSDMLPPAAGRGPVIWDFRGIMMKNAGVEDLAPGSLDEIKVFFAEKASNRIYGLFFFFFLSRSPFSAFCAVNLTPG